MKFTTGLSDDYVDSEEADRLTTIGFDFEKQEGEQIYACIDNPIVTINTLEELIAFKEKAGHALVLHGDDFIEVYNGYRE